MNKKNLYKAVIAIQIITLLLVSGCAFQSIYLKEAKQLYDAGQYDKAVEYYEKALKEHPKRTEIKRQLFRAKLSSYYHHLMKARKYKELNKKEDAVNEYKIALRVFPENKRLQDELDLYLNKKKVKKEKFVSTIKPPVTLKIDTKEKVSLKLTNSTPITKIFKMLGKSYKVNFIFDKDFRDFVYSFEIEDVGFYEVLNQLCMIANTRYRILDSSSILIYPNTTFKKRTLDLRGVKIFYLSNIDADNAKKLLMSVFRDQQIMVQENKDLNCVIVKASSNALVEVEKFLKHIDKQKSEVEIDIEILEVNRNLLNKIGVDYGLNPFNLSAGTVGVNEEGEKEGTLNNVVNVIDLKNLNFFLTLPTAALNFLETDDNNKIIAKPNLRGIHGEVIKFMVGDEIPVPQTSYQAMAAGGVQNIPLTQYTYKNVGVEIQVTPFVHNNKEVTLNIKLTMNFVTGYIGEQSIPSLGKRELENIIRLREGETSIIGGFIRDEVRKSITGFPAFSKIPVLGKLFGNSQNTIQQTDLIFSITPRIIKKTDRDARETDTIWTNTLSSFQNTGSLRDEPGSRRPVRPPGRTPGRESNSVVVSPSKRRVPVNTYSYFTIRLSTTRNVTSLSISGSVSGGKATIEQLKTDFFNKDKTKVLKNHTDDSFDLGYSFLDESARNNVLAQLKIKFLEKGEYTININSVNAYSKERRQIEIKTTSAEVHVY